MAVCLLGVLVSEAAIEIVNLRLVWASAIMDNDGEGEGSLDYKNSYSVETRVFSAMKSRTSEYSPVYYRRGSSI
jgi:hypothetical protein